MGGLHRSYGGCPAATASASARRHGAPRAVSPVIVYANLGPVIARWLRSRTARGVAKKTPARGNPASTSVKDVVVSGLNVHFQQNGCSDCRMTHQPAADGQDPIFRHHPDLHRDAGQHLLAPGPATCQLRLPHRRCRSHPPLPCRLNGRGSPAHQLLPSADAAWPTAAGSGADLESSASVVQRRHRQSLPVANASRH